MSSNKQCAVQDLAPELLAKQQATTAAECRSQDHPQSKDDPYKGNNNIYCM